MRQISRPGVRPALANAGFMTRLPGCLLFWALGCICPVCTGKAGRALSVPAEQRLDERAANRRRLKKADVKSKEYLYLWIFRTPLFIKILGNMNIENNFSSH